MATVTRTGWVAGVDLRQIVRTIGEELDADATADPVPDLGDEGYGLSGDLGTYVHAVSGDDYVIAFASGTADPVGTATGMARLGIP